MPMTQIRHKHLLQLFNTGKAKNSRTQTLNWLRKYKYIDEKNRVTDEGRDYCIGYISLARQCKELGINLQTIQLNYTGRPEDAVLRYFEQQGYIGVNVEGGFLVAVIKALTLNTLAKYNTFNSREDACLRYWHAQMTIFREKHQYSWAPQKPEWPIVREELINEMKNCDRSTFLSQFSEIAATGDPRYDIPLDLATPLYDLIDPAVLFSLGTGFIDDVYHDYGWPDLTLAKQGELRFVEVKTTDKLHSGQIDTIPLLDKLPLLHSNVVKVVKLQQD